MILVNISLIQDKTKNLKISFQFFYFILNKGLKVLFTKFIYLLNHIKGTLKCNNFKSKNVLFKRISKFISYINCNRIVFIHHYPKTR